MIVSLKRNDMELVIQAAEAFAKSELENDRTGHERVANMARRLAEEENADIHICTIAALLHDVADVKLNPTKEIGMAKVKDWIYSQALNKQDQQHILTIISTMSYNGGHNPPMNTIEGQVVQDADRLDALGAIGIARTFLYAGSKGHSLYDPDILPRTSMTEEEYRGNTGTTINHFYEKLLTLKNHMNTTTAKKIAIQRHQYMEEYLEQFFEEWDGCL